MNHNLRNILFTILIVVTAFSCVRRTYNAVYPTLSDGRYDSEFPYRNCSKELDAVSRSVKKLYCIVEYDRYIFSDDNVFTPSILDGADIKKMDVEKRFFSESVHGTATIIKNDNYRLMVMTCAHVVNYPDTIFSFFTDEYGQESRYLESVSIKKRQLNFIRDLPDNGLLEIIKIDKDLDIAFLGKKFDNANVQISVFNYPTGKAKNLEWGNFVYIMGYPAGYQMITSTLSHKFHCQ